MRLRDCNNLVPAVPSRPRSSGFMRNENWKDSVEKMCEAATEEVTFDAAWNRNCSTKNTVLKFPSNVMFSDNTRESQYTNGSKTAVMDVIGFLCVSLGSSRACSCSDTGFSSQNGDRA
jgi:hypothetical protein